MAKLAKTLDKVLLGLVVVMFVGGHVAAYFVFKGFAGPPVDPVEVRWLDQNWEPDDRQWFYHASQGSSFEILTPYPWFVSFEQPKLPLFFLGEVPLLIEGDFLAGFGLLPDPVQEYRPDGMSIAWAIGDRYDALEIDRNNVDRLPVGFDRDSVWVDPVTDSVHDVVGLTCALCHTGQINYNGTGLRIDGAPALTDMNKFGLGFGIALAMTYYIPTRFSRFADRVLGEGYSDAERTALKTSLKAVLEDGEALDKLLKDRKILTTTKEGFGRLDALARIGNYVFGREVSDVNYVVADGPVNFPHIWDTPWLEWAQYNGSIMLPMTRNAGEAMGVAAAANFRDLDDDERLFTSTVDVVSLYEMESLLRGERPFGGLTAPDWPEDVLGPIDPGLAEEGEDLYRQHCQWCHLPPINDSTFFADANWTPEDDFGNRYIKAKMVNLYDIGTDPNQATNFARRVVQLDELGRKFADRGAIGGLGIGGTLTAGAALPLLVRKTKEKRYDDLDVPDSLRVLYDGLREDSVRAPLAYKARPLDGIWATAPYLHNGAVPNLYQLLSPVAERDTMFYLGSKEFDPDNVGFVTDPISGGFELDTSLSGNSNEGHEFRGDTVRNSDQFWRSLGRGVVGPFFGEGERRALVEYLKTLGGPTGGDDPN